MYLNSKFVGTFIFLYNRAIPCNLWIDLLSRADVRSIKKKSAISACIFKTICTNINICTLKIRPLISNSMYAKHNMQ
jgi:hypothetical protein